MILLLKIIICFIQKSNLKLIRNVKMVLYLKVSYVKSEIIKESLKVKEQIIFNSAIFFLYC